MTAPIKTVHIIRQGLSGPPGTTGANGVFSIIASQAEAEAGTDNVKGMTPLRVQQKLTLDLNAAIASLIDNSPSTLDTLNELAAALGDDPSFATTVSTALGMRLRFDAAQALDAGQKAQVQVNAGLAIGIDVQAYNANLDALAGLTLVADKLPYAAAANTMALADLTAAGRAMIGAADAAAQLALLGTIPNASLAHSSVIISGHDVAFGDALDLTQADIAGLTTTDTPTFAGLTINLAGNPIFNLYQNGSNAGSIFISSGMTIISRKANQDLSLMTTGTGNVVITNGTIQLNNIPTSDPYAAGRVWSNGGILTVSAG